MVHYFCSNCGTNIYEAPEGAPFAALSPALFGIVAGDKLQTLPDDLKPTFRDNYENRHMDAHGCSLPK